LYVHLTVKLGSQDFCCGLDMLEYELPCDSIKFVNVMVKFQT
jgi:hypothetical protein